ncbi:MAG: AMP-binding protein [Chloroflexi bacterium]|nr:AMP-binding protein [Chloroflexota bacterium]
MNIVGPRTILHELRARVQTAPTKPWLIFEDRDGDVQQWSLAEFERLVNRAANVLGGLGVRPGDRLVLHLANCPEFLLLWFGAAACGAEIVPVNTLSSPDELQYLINHSESMLIATEPAHLDVVERLRRSCAAARHVLLCRADRDEGAALSFNRLLEQASDARPRHEPKPLDVVAILYTSGTTSRPKGCLITHANYVHVGESVSKGMRLGPDDRFFTVLPLFHGNAQYYSTMSALVVGGSVALMERFSASRYWEQATRHECTVASLFAAPMRMLLAQTHSPYDRQHRLRLVIFAQSLTPEQLAAWDVRFGAPLMQIYGMTEQLGHPLANPLDYPRNNMSIGWPSLGWACRVVDDNGSDVPEGQAGQLLVRGEPGSSLMLGYFKNPEATAETIRDGWLWTGDNVRIGSDDYVYFVDRAKDMIKRSGENVAAGEVEAVLIAHPAVFDAAVIGVPDPILDEAIKAFVVLHEGEHVTADELIAWCAERLARFRVPELVEFRAELPRTSVGKIQKHVLRAESLRDA